MNTVGPEVNEEENSRMEVSEEVPEVTINSDSSGDDDCIALSPSVNKSKRNPRRTQKVNLRGRPRAPTPDVIDLTNDDDASTNNIANGEPMVVEVEPVTRAPEEIAEEHKRKGNDYFKSKDYYQALAMYDSAIEAVPTEASFYGNRSACLMMLLRYKDALADIKHALQIDPNYEKGYLRLIRTTLALGNVKECEMAYAAVAAKGLNVGAEQEAVRLNHLKTHLGHIETFKAKKEYRTLVYHINQALEVATADNTLKMLKAHSFVHLGRHAEAQELCTEVLQNDARCPEALYIRALMLYLDDNIDKSIQFVRQGLQYAPDNSSFQVLYKKLKLVKELRDSASAKFSSFQYDEAQQDYTQCLSLVSEGEMTNITIQSKINFNLALIAGKTNRMDDSIDACSKAIQLNPKYLKAVIHRARLYVKQQKYDDAVHDFEAALKIDPKLSHLKHELQSAKLEAKKAKRKDYYKILNIEKTATDDEIRRAYKKRALLHHPDRHANAPEAVQKEQEKLFKDLGEAYEVLSDSKKRFRYDQGHDLVEDRGFDHSYDPSADFINVFFGGGGIPSFRPSGANRPQFHTFRH